MEKIVLTEFGECLLGYLSTKTNDRERLGVDIGLHEGCGSADFKSVSATHNVIYCSRCGLRVIIPKKIDTYGKLRKYLGNKLLASAKQGG